MKQRVNILLVDDQPSRLLSYEAILEELDQNLVKASSGVEALQKLMQEEFAVILLDVSMPGLDGFETAAMIHQHPRFEKTPIIFVTALHVTDLDRLKGYAVGAVDYVYVPVVPQILRSKVSVLVELHTKRRELQELNRTLAEANAELALANSTLQAEKTRELEQLNNTLERANAELALANRTLLDQIAERKRVEDALRTSEERQRAILQATSALIYQVDGDGRFVHVNRSFEDVFGVEKDELVGKPLDRVFPLEVATEFAANNRRVIDAGRPMEFEETLVGREGPHTYASVKAPLGDDQGRTCGIVGVSTDITERKRLEEALRDADRRKDEFLAILAHELRNPLAPIRNAVQLMQRRPTDDPDLVWSRDLIDRQVEQLVRLVDDLLDVSRITQGKIKLRKTPIEIGDLVKRSVETHRVLIDARSQKLSIDVPSEPAWVEGDLTRLSQVLGNLLSNAAKYTEDGGQIAVRVETVRGARGAPEVVVRVKDSGVGIPADMLPKLFQLFMQVDRTVDRAQGGLGIGLALARRLVEMHGGTVTAHSDGAGRGSEFVVRLPIWVAPKDAVATGPASSRTEVCAPSRRVLVVDDNVDSARSLAKMMQLEGYETSTAHDGLEALEVAERIRPDVLLLDLGMPKLDGYRTAGMLREKPWGKRVVLIAVTGWGQEDVREKTRSAGFDAHLVKPVEMPVLFELVRKLSAQAAREGGDAGTAPEGDSLEPSVDGADASLVRGD